MVRLRQAAARRGVSMAAIVREAVEQALDDDPEDRRRRWARALEAVGSHRAGDAGRGAGVARYHDAYLPDAYAAVADDRDHPPG